MYHSVQANRLSIGCVYGRYVKGGLRFGFVAKGAEKKKNCVFTAVHMQLRGK